MLQVFSEHDCRFGSRDKLQLQFPIERPVQVA